MNLDSLLRRQPALWRGGAPGPLAQRPGIPTGFDVLDQHLAGNGWPRGALTEILCAEHGAGALALLMPALAALGEGDAQIFLVAPPLIPYAPGLSAKGVVLSRLLWVQPRGEVDCLWTLEQILAAGGGAVLAWPGRPRPAQLRRLQLAAERGGGVGFLFRSLDAEGESSPAALRLRVSRDGGGVDILKRRGGWPVHGLRLDSG